MLNETLNATNLTFTEFNDLSLFNPSLDCTREWAVCQKMISEFKVEIINTVSTRFKIALTLLTILIIYKLYTEYSKPKFSQTIFYKEKIAYRIDFILMITLICLIGLMFI